MKTPIFAHGKMESVQRAIESGKITYPSYVWIDDIDEYAFLNKDGELEICGIPKLVGTLNEKIILSSLDDGLYQVRGQHKITATHVTTFDSSGFILVVVQTVNGVKKVRRIDADELTSYIINEDLSVTENEVATKEYLEEHGYATEGYVDEKIATMESIILADVEAALPDMLEPIVRPVVEEVVDETIQPEDDEDIRNLFN